MEAQKQKNLKFKTGDIVVDIYSSIIGRITGYLGRGIYTLDQIRSPFHDIRGNLIGFLPLRYGVLQHPHINGGAFFEGFAQTSRYLSLITRQDIIDKYNTVIDLNEEGNNYYFFDGYHCIYPLKEIFAEYRGGQSPIGFGAVFNYTYYWAVSGNFMRGEIHSVTKVTNVNENTFRINANNTNRLISQKDLEPVFKWETEIGPFAIQGKLL